LAGWGGLSWLPLLRRLAWLPWLCRLPRLTGLGLCPWLTSLGRLRLCQGIFGLLHGRDGRLEIVLRQLPGRLIGGLLGLDHVGRSSRLLVLGQIGGDLLLLLKQLLL
jgi:hypothetical protein